MAPDDVKILQGCLRGEKNAWDGFVDRYSKLIYWSIWRSLETRGVPNKEDICRETFQEFFRRMLEPARLEKAAGAVSLPKYLQVTAANLTGERFRRSETLGRFEVAQEDADAPAADLNEAGATERRAILHAVLGSLKPRVRACLELHYLDGQTHQAISQQLGIPQDTVSSILRRAKETVRKRLKDKGLEEDAG